MAVTKEQKGQVAIVTLTNPPVNAIGQAMRQGLLDAVRWAEEAGLTRVVLTGDGRAFAAGADAREFDGAPQEPHLPDVIAAIEASPVPWVAAINGVALGGGAELALGCRVRVIAPTAQIGFPEVTLGVIPGAGGTQRLPRLVGLDIAAEMVSLGKPMGSEAAHACGLVDLVAKDTVAAALAMSSDDLARAIPLNERPAPAAEAGIL